MNRLCSVSGCKKTVTARYSILCNTHKQHKRRYGDPLQPIINRAELKPYIRYVERLLKRDVSGKIETGLIRLRILLMDSAKDVSMEFHDQGRAMNSFWVRANEEILDVLNDTNALQPATIIAALYLLSHEKPYRFVSDRGFLFQLVRQFRKLTSTGVGSYWDHKTGRVKQVYRDLPPRVTELMGKKIIEAYAPWVASVVRRHEAEGKALDEAKRLLAEGMDSITVKVA